MKTNLIYLAAASLLFACNSTPEKTDEVVESTTIDLALSPKGNGKVKAQLRIFEQSGKVLISGNFENLTQGKHGIHLHETGDCSADDASSAGGHWNPTNEAHGKWGVAPFHRGDIGNFEADKDGVATIEFKTDLWCIGCGDPVKDILGKTVIIHAGEDDCTSQPSGNAGARVEIGRAHV